MALTKYRLGDLIEQRREKFDGGKDLPIRGVSVMGLFRRNKKMQTPLYITCFIEMILFSILHEWN